MYSIKIVCEQVLDHDGWPIVRDGEVVWLVVDEWGEYYHCTDYGDGDIHPDAVVFDTEEEAKAEALLVSKDMLWYIKPKSYEVVCVEPVYETKIVGWKVKGE